MLPSGVRSRLVHDVNGITLHILEAGFEVPGRPLMVLLHGFPELAYSWRKVLVPLAEQGYHVIAPDVRGYGRSGGAGVFIIWCALDDLLLVLLFIIVAFFDRRQDFLNLEYGIQRLRIL